MNYLFPAVTCGISFVFFCLTIYAKHVWRDKGRTQAFGMVAIITALGFMYWVWFESGIE